MKKSIYIDTRNYLERLSEQTFSPEFNLSLIEDPIRYFSKNFWTMVSGVLDKAKNHGESLFSIDSHSDDIIILKCNKSRFTNLDEYGRPGTYDPKQWEKFINFISTSYNKNFVDNSFSFHEPINVTELKNLEKNTNIVNREFIYNFYCDKYDVLSSDRTLDVRTLPDIFSVIKYKDTNGTDTDSYTKLSFLNTISDDLINSVLISKDKTDNLVNYFNEIAENYDNDSIRSSLNIYKSLNSTYDIDEKTNFSLKQYKYVPFPSYSEITLTNHSNKKDNFIHFLSETPSAKKELNFFLRQENNFLNYNFIYEKDSSKNISIKIFDVKSWLESGLAEPTVFDGGEASFVDENFRQYKHIDYANIIDYIKNNIKNRTRKYKNINDPVENNEVLFYKIEKKQFSANSDTVVQTFWLTPDTSDYFRLIDTQLRYGTNYYYKIYAYVLNVSNRYTYSNYYRDELERLADVDSGQYKIRVNNESLYNICEIEIATLSGSVLETPPPKPKVSMQYDNNQLKIKIQESNKEEYEKYKLIENRDFDLLEQIRLSQDNNDKEKVKFGTETGTNLDLQIYKTTTRPTNYLSFQDKRYKTVRLNGAKELTDSIVPGIKYYYTFRYINKHNCPSNPTIVYELELKNEDDYVYLNVNTIDLDKGPEMIRNKDMKRYLLLRPSILQMQKQIPEKISSINDISLGPKGRNIWDSADKRQFVLRITSKKSNRVLEFNIGAIINRKNK